MFPFFQLGVWWVLGLAGGGPVRVGTTVGAGGNLIQLSVWRPVPLFVPETLGVFFFSGRGPGPQKMAGPGGGCEGLVGGAGPESFGGVPWGPFFFLRFFLRHFCPPPCLPTCLGTPQNRR